MGDTNYWKVLPEVIRDEGPVVREHIGRAELTPDLKH